MESLLVRLHLALLLLALLASNAHAAELETLLMPGKVATAHAKIEAQCAECHDRSDRARQASLCSSCHVAVRDDVRDRTGFHGRLIGNERMQCRACHSEHRGRDADIVRLLPAQFDHALTDFPLRDAHALAACEGCHVSGKRYREAPHECVACHRQDEPHRGALGERCDSCHTTATWTRIDFAHDRTKFALNGGHADLACVACHFDNRFAQTPRACQSCHAPDDPHRGARGEDCSTCHTTSQWTSRRFDHARETGFALFGAHARVACAGCHTSGRMQDPLPKDCHGCHSARDAHAGRFGAQCDSCHGPERWPDTSFDHAKTRFALTGPHRDLDCHACHTADVATQKLSGDCVSCHLGRDVHAGRLGRDCASCHVADGWRRDVRFDHDLTEFPLLGQHVVVGCEQCHVTAKYKDTASDCVSCHERDDKHRGGLGRQCDSCHSPNGWNDWRFDHAGITGFALTGSHEKLPCADCHRRPPEDAPLARECVSCHAKDDAHFGDFGRQCQRCHSTISFRQARIR